MKFLSGHIKFFQLFIIFLSFQQTIELRNAEIKELGEASKEMKRDKQDDSVRPELRQSSSSLPVKKQGKIKKSSKKSELGATSEGAQSKKPDMNPENCIWNPLFGRDFLKKFGK